MVRCGQLAVPYVMYCVAGARKQAGTSYLGQLTTARKQKNMQHCITHHHRAPHIATQHDTALHNTKQLDDA